MEGRRKRMRERARRGRVKMRREEEVGRGMQLTEKREWKEGKRVTRKRKMRTPMRFPTMTAGTQICFFFLEKKGGVEGKGERMKATAS